MEMPPSGDLSVCKYCPTGGVRGLTRHRAPEVKHNHPRALNPEKPFDQEIPEDGK
jgi:hypothetical protein